MLSPSKQRKPYHTPKERHSALIKRRGGYHRDDSKEYNTAALEAKFEYEIKDIVDKIKAKQLSMGGG